jgi:hypothetical protein
MKHIAKLEKSGSDEEAEAVIFAFTLRNTGSSSSAVIMAWRFLYAVPFERETGVAS